MSRLCPISGKGVMVGNNVSHANNKSRRRFLPNLQNTSFVSDVLKQNIRLRLAVRAIRTVERKGGLDSYLASIKLSQVSDELRPLKRAFDKMKARSAEKPLPTSKVSAKSKRSEPTPIKSEKAEHPHVA